MSALATLVYVIAAAVGLLSGIAAVTVFWMILTEPLRLMQLLGGWM
jgi:NhaP-type Na+/H+ or K+/H+ antiporter